MRAYITCPISHTKERLLLLPEIKAVVEAAGIEAFVFQEGGTPTEIFERDFSELKKCNLIIAEVSERSHGVGIEIGMSYPLGLKRILLIQQGQFVSKLAQGIPDTTIIEYQSVNDLKSGLSVALSNLIK